MTEESLYKVFRPKRRIYQNELIYCMMKLQVFCGIVYKTVIFTVQIF